MNPLELVRLRELMEITQGSPSMKIGLIDGPVATHHEALNSGCIRELGGDVSSICENGRGLACIHGTFVAGILSAKRSSIQPGICPSCTLMVRPVFIAAADRSDHLTPATQQELGDALVECVDRGARIINLSLAQAYPSSSGEPTLQSAISYAASRGVLVIAAAGNQGALGGTAITRHPWVIPVVACDSRGHPLAASNLSKSIGNKGLCAPGDRITSLGPNGASLTLSGTSVATPFVAGAAALLWSEFPHATVEQIRMALSNPNYERKATIVPRLLDAFSAFRFLARHYGNGSEMTGDRVRDSGW